MTILAICHSCFSRITLSQRPRTGLCIVCPTCGEILESIHIVPPTQDWAFEDSEDFEDNDLRYSDWSEDISR